MDTVERQLAGRFADALGLAHRATATGCGTLASTYPVSALGTAAVGTAGAALAELVAALGAPRPGVVVHRDRVDAWYRCPLTPEGWTLPPVWDPVSADYRARDGWIRLHANAPRHRAALGVLGVPADRDALARAVAAWRADELEAAVVTAGGAAAALRTAAAWSTHPRGAAVAREPLVDTRSTDGGPASTTWRPTPARPLAGLRVLDLTRVLAGPTATQVLAAFGADVLRVDPPDWTEPGVVPLVMLGKRSARLDARRPAGRDALHALLQGADVLVHGYRRGALPSLGLGEAERRHLRPGLVDVSLVAYGHTGPWAERRGFDSLVQMSSGIAATGQAAERADRPVPLPVQALDHATGWLAAAAVLTGLTRSLRSGRGVRSRLSLARTAVELERARSDQPAGDRPHPPPGPPSATDRIGTGWGPARLVRFPVDVDGAPARWARGPRPLGGDDPTWPGEPCRGAGRGAAVRRGP